MRTIVTFFLLMLFILGTSVSKAQSPFKATISMGTITPLKPYSSRDFNDTRAGFANQGFVLNIDGDYFLHNRFALSGRMHIGTNQVDQDSYFTKLDQDVKPYMPDSFKNAHYNAGYWQWISPMLGAKYNYPVVLNKAWLEAGIFSGVQFTSIPDQSMMVEDEVKKERIITENLERRDISFPLVIEGGLRLKINRLTQINIKAAYHQAKANYTHVSYRSDPNGNQIGDLINNNQQTVPIKNVQFTIGLTYLFEE